MKNEFFIHLDGVATNEDDHITIIGATNRPEELDEAVRRRFARRLYIPLPEKQGRQKIIENLLKKVDHNLTTAQIERIAELTEGYSGADMSGLCKYAAIQPLRSLSSSQMKVIEPQQVRLSKYNSYLNLIVNTQCCCSCKPSPCRTFRQLLLTFQKVFHPTMLSATFHGIIFMELNSKVVFFLNFYLNLLRWE